MAEIAMQPEYMNINDFARAFMELMKASRAQTGIPNWPAWLLADILDGEYTDFVAIPKERQTDAMRYVGERLAQGLKRYEEKNLYAAPSEKIIYPQVARALREYPDPEAKKFINMMRVVASIAKSNIDPVLSGMLLKSIGENGISDPDVQYYYLTVLKNKSTNQDIKNEVYYKMATHPNATVKDLLVYASVCKPDELEGVYARAEQIIDSQIEGAVPHPERGDFGNPDELKQLLQDAIQDLNEILNVMHYRLPDSDRQKLDEKITIRKELLTVKYDLKTILDFHGDSYFQDFEQSVSASIAETVQENKQLQDQVAELEKSKTATETELTKAKQQLQEERTAQEEASQKYETQIAELNKASTQNSAEQEHLMKILEIKIGAIKTFLMAFDEKKGQTFNRGRDLAELGEFLKTAMYGDPKDPEKSYNWIKEMETMIAKRKTEQMQGAKI